MHTLDCCETNSSANLRHPWLKICRCLKGVKKEERRMMIRLTHQQQISVYLTVNNTEKALSVDPYLSS